MTSLQKVLKWRLPSSLNPLRYVPRIVPGRCRLDSYKIFRILRLLLALEVSENCTLDRFDWTMDVVMDNGRHRDHSDRYHCTKRHGLLTIHVNVRRSGVIPHASVSLTLNTGTCECNESGLLHFIISMMSLSPQQLYP